MFFAGDCSLSALRLVLYRVWSLETGHTLRPQPGPMFFAGPACSKAYCVTIFPEMPPICHGGRAMGTRSARKALHPAASECSKRSLLNLLAGRCKRPSKCVAHLKQLYSCHEERPLPSDLVSEKSLGILVELDVELINL